MWIVDSIVVYCHHCHCATTAATKNNKQCRQEVQEPSWHMAKVLVIRQGQGAIMQLAGGNKAAWAPGGLEQMGAAWIFASEFARENLCIGQQGVQEVSVNPKPIAHVSVWGHVATPN